MVQTLLSMWSRVGSLSLVLTIRGLKAHFLECGLVAVAYAIYILTRGLLFSDLAGKGVQNAAHVISAEKWAGFFWEPGWQTWILENVDGLALFFNWVYIFTYWPIIVVVGLALYILNRARYYYYRTVVVINLVFALVIFMLFPVTSPFNFTDHFVNTIQTLGPSFYGSSEMASYYNTNAAMPSLHFSWTVILGVLFLRTFKGWFKLLGVVYPVMTLFAITLTGNHFILDAVAGGVLAAAAFGVMELGFRRGLLRRERAWAAIQSVLDRERWVRVYRSLLRERDRARQSLQSRWELTWVALRRLVIPKWNSLPRSWALRDGGQLSVLIRRHLAARHRATR